MSNSGREKDSQQMPVSWEEVSVQQLGDIVSGGTPSREISAFWGGTIPWVTPGEVTGVRVKYVTTTKESITEEGVRNSGAKKLPTGSLLITTRATIGAVAINAIPLCTNQGFQSLVLNDGVDSNFYYHVFKFLAHDLSTRASGSTFLELSRKGFANFSVPKPSLREQVRIGAILDGIATTIWYTEELIIKLKQMRAGLLRDLLTLGLDEQGQLRDPVLHPERFQSSQLGLIPDSWHVTTLAAVASIDRGKFAHRPRNDPRYYGGTYPFIQTGDVSRADGGILDAYSQTLNDNGAKVSREFPSRTIAVTIAANIADTAILGKSMYFPDSIVGVIPDPEHSVRYFEMWIRNAKERLNAVAPQSAQKNINLQDLRRLSIALPSPEEQARIARAYELIDVRIRSEESHCDKLRQIKQGLMDDLLTGHVHI